MKEIERVHAGLKEDVFQALYKPDQLITEREIAEKYGVSKVTAGEALHQLCRDGHLLAIPRSGYIVRPTTPEEFRQLKRLRMVLESLAIDILCDEIPDSSILTLSSFIIDDCPPDINANTVNRRFHLKMAELTGDQYLISALDAVLGAATRVEQYVSPVNKASWQDEHRMILEALKERNASLAKQHLTADLNQR